MMRSFLLTGWNKQDKTKYETAIQTILGRYAPDGDATDDDLM